MAPQGQKIKSAPGALHAQRCVHALAHQLLLVKGRGDGGGGTQLGVDQLRQVAVGLREPRLARRHLLPGAAQPLPHRRQLALHLGRLGARAPQLFS